jgi:hypothetical protein
MAIRKPRPIAKNQYRVTLKGIDTYWEQFSGLDDQSQSSDYSDGLSNKLYPLVGPRTLGEMSLEKSFDPEADEVIVQYWKNFRHDPAETQETVTVQSIRYGPQPEPIGKALVLYGVVPIGLSGFEADKSSQDISKLILTIRAEEWDYV